MKLMWCLFVENKFLLRVVSVLTSCVVLYFTGKIETFAEPWNPPDGEQQVTLWPGIPPDSIQTEGPENVVATTKLVGGKPWHAVSNVSNPTYTVFSPSKVKNTGAAVIVFPGGGYKVLAIDLEGTEICDWLSSEGITCVLLKYRVPNSGCHYDEAKKQHITPKVFTALQDAQRTIGLIRRDAPKLGINPSKIGVIGFSAGGNLVAMVSSRFSKRNYASVDSADEVSSRPDFAIALYPGHMSIMHKNIREYGDTKLNPDIEFNKNSPPTFLLHAKDDDTNPVAYSQLYEKALKSLNVQVELHLFEKGQHAFGLRKPELPISKWPTLVMEWLRKIKILTVL
jgi:acetyl esterase/lipase